MKFEFRNSASQIGGDFVLADNLRLGNKIIVFAITDAMGKIDAKGQGALILVQS